MANLLENLKFIVVDDDKMLRDFTVFLLKVRLKIPEKNIRTAVNGKEALALMNKDPADFIVTDYQMPEMDGVELTRNVRLNKNWADTRILMASGGGTITEVEALEAFVDAFLSKPFKPAQFEKKIQEILDKKPNPAFPPPEPYC